MYVPKAVKDLEIYGIKMEKLTLDWIKNPNINPSTKRTIKTNGSVYMKYLKYFDSMEKPNQYLNQDTLHHETIKYAQYRKEYIDPITLDSISPGLIDSDNVFKFYYKWDPYTGEKTEIDPLGPLCFDPHALMYFYYSNRLRHLWNQTTDEDGNVMYFFGDGVGNGDDFYLPSRGEHPDWYLFRLPIIDCYLGKDHNDQVVTMGPKLTKDEIKQLVKLASKSQKINSSYPKKNYKKLVTLYHDSIVKKPDLKLGYEPENYILPSDLQAMYYERNILAIDKLIKL